MYCYLLVADLNQIRYNDEWSRALNPGDRKKNKPPNWIIEYSVPGKDSSQTDGSSCGVFTSMSLYLYAKIGTREWPTNADLGTADIPSARDFMMYTICVEKQQNRHQLQTRIQSEIEIEISETQAAIDAMDEFIKAQQNWNGISQKRFHW